MPGFATPTEAFATVTAGARRLKAFPATGLGPRTLKMVREVLPPTARRRRGAVSRAGDDAATVAARADCGLAGAGLTRAGLSLSGICARVA